MSKFFFSFVLWAGFLWSANVNMACHKKDPVIPEPSDTVVTPPHSFDIDAISDTYPELASADFANSWGSHNVHDPSIFFDGDYYYCYSTDAAYGVAVRPGIQIRRSRDLIEWQFAGWVFNALPTAATSYIQQHGGTPNNGLWAPYILKSGSEYRLYYALSSTPKPRLSAIGLATATGPLGPWTDKGIVVSSTDDNSTQTNAIDPTVLVDQQGRHWLFYGSAWDGIYRLPLNPATGLSALPGTRGERVAQRGFTGNTPNGNIEGAEIIYNPAFNRYYLFLAYDWLATKYNVRVGRADSPDGPFYDWNGKDLNVAEDNVPMLVAPYRFQGHGGYQGTAHCSVFTDDEGNFYLAHQARPSVNPAFMNLHVREIFWTPDGWPLVSPERYAGRDETPVTASEISGNWEQIALGYQVVPGYQNEQLSPDLQESAPTALNPDGSMGAVPGGHWSWQSPWLSLEWPDGRHSMARVARGRDWENKKPCLIYTGLDQNGTAVWGKKTL